MRASIIALSLALAACATTPGASAPTAPFNAAPTTQAQTPAPANYPIAADVPAGTYRLDPRHASVFFRIRHIGLSWFTARMNKVEASLELNAQDPSQSRLSASVDATSVDTNVLNQAGERAFDRSIGNAIGAQRTQQITFTSTSIERTGQYTARITGDLTLNGQTHPATLDATFEGGAVDPLRGANEVLAFSAHGTIDRTQWGVTQWGTVTGNDVQIVVEAEFVKA